MKKRPLIPCGDVIGSILCCIVLRKEGHSDTPKQQKV